MIRKSLFILGRQPAIGRAELESLFGAEHVEAVGQFAMACDKRVEDIPFDRIGSSIRLARPVAVLPTTDWIKCVRLACKELPALIDYLPLEGKIKLGISAFDMPVQESQLLRSGLELKKVCKKAGRSVRVVPNVEAALNSAQVLHNQLTGEMGIELLFIRDNNQTVLAQTFAIQDITAYAERDQKRPKRDSFVGMLPPKLAQTIINLSAGQLPASPENIILDPFCGTGVLLQEALLMGYGVYGSDLQTRMIDFSQKNLEWLETHGVKNQSVLEVGDATEHKWSSPFTAVASETYLGRPLSAWPKPEVLHEIIGTCNLIISKFLANLSTQIPAGTRLCLAAPAWQAPSGHVHHLTALDQLSDLGYNRVRFSWAKEQEMVYRRPDQVVARELVVLIKK